MKTGPFGNNLSRLIVGRESAPMGVSPLLERTLVMDRLLDLLLQKAKARLNWPEVYIRAEAVLASLALSTEEYRLARQRLQNALAYTRCGDFGPATFELRQLRGQLA